MAIRPMVRPIQILSFWLFALLAGCGPSLAERIPGVWRVEPSLSSLPSTDLPPFDLQIEEAVRNARLELGADGQYSLTGLEMLNISSQTEGTWTLQGSLVSLRPRGRRPERPSRRPGVSLVADAHSTPMRLLLEVPGPDQKTLRIVWVAATD